MSPFFIITDYNHLPQDLSDSWLPKYVGNNYLLYDKAHRWEESQNIKRQINVGHNIYDMFDYIVNNYNNLPEIMVFCKGNVFPRHCSEEKFESILKNNYFTPIENYIRTMQFTKIGDYSYVDENDGYFEKSFEVNYTLTIHPSIHFQNYQQFLEEIFENPICGEYIRFAPGANYLLTSQDILKYNKYFYENARHWVSWQVRPGEAFLFERSLYTLFSSDFKIKEKYKN